MSDHDEEEISPEIQKAADEAFAFFESAKSDLFANVAASDFESQFRSGNPGILMLVIAAAIHRGEPAPKWAADAFVEKVISARGYNVKSWDDLFGAPHPPGYRPDAHRKYRHKSPMIVVAVRHFRNEGCSLEEALEHAARLNNVSASTARDYYYRFKRELEDLD